MSLMSIYNNNNLKPLPHTIKQGKPSGTFGFKLVKFDKRRVDPKFKNFGRCWFSECTWSVNGKINRKTLFYFIDPVSAKIVAQICNKQVRDEIYGKRNLYD